MSEAAPVLLGHRKNGRPIYLIQGGAEAPAFQQPAAPTDPPAPVDPPDTDDPPSADPPEGDTDSPDEGDLGEAGKRALHQLRAQVKEETAKRRAAESKRRAAEAKAAALEAKATKPTEGEPTPEEIRRTAREEAQAEVVRERALDRVEVLAAKSFTDPADARMFLAASVEDFLDSGSIDSEAINEALADLLKARPYLAIGAPRRFSGTGDGGYRGTKPKDLDSQIAEAQAKGDISAYLRLQHQKFPTT
jgi:hypothetical protein